MDLHVALRRGVTCRFGSDNGPFDTLVKSGNPTWLASKIRLVGVAMRSLGAGAGALDGLPNRSLTLL